MKSSCEIFRLASGVWERHRPDCETDFVKSWVKNRPRLKLWMTKIYKVNFMIYSVWPERNNRAHKLIREVFTEARQQTCTGRKRFCNHRRHISCSDPATTSILLFWLFLDLMEKLRAVSHKVNLLCHQESVNHTELCGYNRLESINTTLVLSIAHKPVITSHLEDCQLLQYDLLCDPVVFNDRHRLHHLPIICNIKRIFDRRVGILQQNTRFHFSFETKLCPNKTSAKTVLDLCRRDETVRMHQQQRNCSRNSESLYVLSFPKQSQEFCSTTASQESPFGRWRVWKTKLHDQSSFPRWHGTQR